MTLDNMVAALQQLKGWRGLPCWIEDPKGIDGLGVMTEDLIDNLITLVEFVEDLPSDLEQCKGKAHSVSYDRGLDRAISHVKDFVNGLKNPEAPVTREEE